MRRASFVGVNCSVSQCLEVVGERWTMLIDVRSEWTPPT
jgi:DNA-binding HxlR family transcriptional regulator